MLGWGRAVTCVRGDRFPISSRTSWLCSPECMLCLEIFSWAAVQELFWAAQQADVEWRGADCGEAQTLGQWGSKPGGQEPSSRAAIADGDGMRVPGLRTGRTLGSVVTHCQGPCPPHGLWDPERPQILW